jgi:phosphopantetheine--protein transferase-like protein
MDNTQNLKAAIAKILNVSESSITDTFSLDIQKLKSSAGAMILQNVVKKIYKKTVNCNGVTDFGDLLSRITDTDISNGDQAEIHEIKIKPEIAVPVEQTISSDMPFPTAFGVSCGIDIQDISIFPESDDYWLEPFYKDNFTDEEIAYCAADTTLARFHFAARWCVKEALKKTGQKYLNLSFKSIQVKKHQDGSVFLEILSDGLWHRVSGTCSMSFSGNTAIGLSVVYNTNNYLNT